VPTPVPVSVTLVENSVCGPDITAHVIEVLRKVIKDFEGNPGKQSEACQRLVDPRTGNYAWDIIELDPGTSPDGSAGDEYDRSIGAWKNKNTHAVIHPWFTRISDKCAIPRPQCAHTVEFLGICQHPQIVNYTLWGVAMSLCGSAYNAAGEAERNARNAYSSLTGTPAEESQSNAVEIGRSIYDDIKSNPNNADIAKLKKKFFDLTSLQRGPRGGIAKDVLACRLHCQLDAATQAKFDKQEFDYNWDGLTTSSAKRGAD
jgi:hypothetical protein